MINLQPCSVSLAWSWDSTDNFSSPFRHLIMNRSLLVSCLVLITLISGFDSRGFFRFKQWFGAFWVLMDLSNSQWVLLIESDMRVTTYRISLIIPSLPSSNSEMELRTMGRKHEACDGIFWYSTSLSETLWKAISHVAKIDILKRKTSWAIEHNHLCCLYFYVDLCKNKKTPIQNCWCPWWVSYKNKN